MSYREMPYVGAIVWYYRDRTYANKPPLGGMITFVHSHKSVNLAVFDYQGGPYMGPTTNVPLMLDVDDKCPNIGHFCTPVNFLLEDCHASI